VLQLIRRLYRAVQWPYIDTGKLSNDTVPNHTLITTDHQALFIYNRTNIAGWFPVFPLKNVLPHVQHSATEQPDWRGELRLRNDRELYTQPTSRYNDLHYCVNVNGNTTSLKPLTLLCRIALQRRNLRRQALHYPQGPRKSGPRRSTRRLRRRRWWQGLLVDTKQVKITPIEWMWGVHCFTEFHFASCSRRCDGVVNLGLVQRRAVRSRPRVVT